MKLGIVGTGMIVQDLLKTIDMLDIERVFVFSSPRSIETAKQMCLEHNFDGYDSDYNAFLQRDIDTVYIALPNHLHFSFSKQALENNKHVIIEKPITANLDELLELKQIADDKNLIILEAMNIHYLPNYKNIKKYLPKIGSTKIVNFNYSQYSSRYDAFKEGNILPAFDFHKAGGALMDINVYNIHGVIGLFGKPLKVNYLANKEKGIDTSGILTLDYGSFKAVCIGAKDCKAPLMLTIQGDEGVIKIDKPLSQATKFEYINNDNKIETIEISENEHRLYYEFVEFIDIINSSNFTKANEMLAISEIACEVMVQARKQEGIVFDNDK